jgi:ATP phosphoribosyltransferase regulatory subunit
VDVLLLYDADTDKMAVAKAVEALTGQGKTVSTQKSIPPKLRYRKLLKLSKEGSLC